MATGCECRKDIAGLLGVMADHEPDAIRRRLRTICRCGCPALAHTPCCGACINCGNHKCPEFAHGH